MTDEQKREALTEAVRNAGVAETDIPAVVAKHLPTAGWTAVPGEASEPRINVPGEGFAPVAYALSALADKTRVVPTRDELRAAYVKGNPPPAVTKPKPLAELSTAEYVEMRRKQRREAAGR